MNKMTDLEVARRMSYRFYVMRADETFSKLNDYDKALGFTFDRESTAIIHARRHAKIWPGVFIFDKATGERLDPETGKRSKL